MPLARKFAVCRALLSLFAIAAGPIMMQAQAPAPDSTAKPLLILVHGRNQAFRISSVLGEEWYSAIDDGLAKVGARGLIADADRRFVYYAGVYEHGSVSSPPCPAGSTGLPYTRAQLPLFVGAMAQYLSTGERNDAVGRMRGLAEDLLRSPKVLALQLPDVKRYKTSLPTRCETERALDAVLDTAAMQNRPVVIAAHSMGSLVTFSVLEKRRAACESPLISAPGDTGAARREESARHLACGPRVVRLVTFGAQIGAYGMPQWLMGKDWETFKPHVRSWTNAVGRDDALAFPVRNRARLLAVADTVADLYVPTRAQDQHWFGGYLKNPEVAKAIASGWCGAEPTPEPACARLAAPDPKALQPFPAAKLFILVPYFAVGEDGALMNYLAAGALLRTTLLPTVFRVEFPFEGFRDTVRTHSSHVGRIYALFPLDVRLLSAEDRESGIRVNSTVGMTIGAGRVYRTPALHPTMPDRFANVWTVGFNNRLAFGPIGFMGEYAWAGGLSAHSRRFFHEHATLTMGFVFTSGYLRY